MKIAACVFGFWLPVSIVSAEPIDAARSFLEQNRAFRGEVKRSNEFDVVREVIAAKPDPETKFGYVVFSVARHSSKLLSEAQAKELDKVIDARKNAVVNWHDVRNVVRVHAQIRLWKYAAELDDTKAEQLRADWKTWNDLRIAYMFEEFVAQERFQRAAWEVLTKDQRAALLAGEWDELLKRSTGHGRQFSANKQVLRVLKKADQTDEFDFAVSRWEKAWKPVLESYQAASLFQRKREFSMDEASEDFAITSWAEYETAFHGFSETECDAIRGIVQAAYKNDPELADKIANYQKNLKSEMVKKYETKAADFLRKLGVL